MVARDGRALPSRPCAGGAANRELGAVSGGQASRVDGVWVRTPVGRPSPVGALVPPHLHTREDEYSIVTEGETGSGPATARRCSGRAGTSPSRAASCTRCGNAGSAPARMIEVISPARFEHFFRELSDLTAAGPPDMAAIGGLAKAYGLRFGEAPWLPDIIARYQLTHRSEPTSS